MIYKIILLFTILSALNPLYSADKPSWINTPESGCSKISELCTVGFGNGRDEATRSAKIEMAKIFSTSISSVYAQNLAANSGFSSEDIQEGITEETKAVLEGVQTSKVFEQPDGYFVLVLLDKKIAADGIKLKISDIDTEIKTIFEDKDTVAKAKLKKLFTKRQTLNQTYLFLTGAEIVSPIASDLIFKTNKAAAKGVIVHIFFDEKEPKPFEAATIKSFTDMGYKVTSGAVVSLASTHAITGKVVAEKQFINVRGFKKFKVILKVTVSNNKKIETGHLNLESTATGRNYQQAYETAVKEISNELKDKVNDLNIE
jgi:hypothetical protein